MPKHMEKTLIRDRWFASTHVGTIDYLYRGTQGIVADVHTHKPTRFRFTLGWSSTIDPKFHVKDLWRPTRAWAIASVIKRIETYHGQT